jgi:hypothetical protein
VAMLAMQDDYMKRVRGGGARDQLRAEGIVILGPHRGPGARRRPRPAPDEFVCQRFRPSRVIDA